tara:strand:- start:1315 stop:1461 length:147 start_codon:yes stop_codon:yes gene_type:complete
MTLSKAGRIIQAEAEFLGKTWDWVMEAIATNPMMFPDRAIEAHKVLTQ